LPKGPGVLSIPLAEKIAALKKANKLDSKTVEVIGSDFSPKMVAVLAKNMHKSESNLQEIIHPRVLDGMV